MPRFIVFTLILFFLLFLKSVLFLDPDFGWHLRMGEIIAESGVPATDQFTYTMPSFPHVDHEWLTDLVIFKLHSVGGYPLLAFLYTLIFISTIYLSVPSNIKNRYFYLGFILMGIGVIFPYFGIRHQALTWFYLAFLVRVLTDTRLYKSLRFYIPFLFLLWANTHGGFIVGLFILWVLVGYEVLFKKAKPTNLLVPIFSTLVTFINPYQESLWREVFSSLADARLRWTINEWMPSIWLFDLSMLWFMAFAMLSIKVNYKKFKLSELFIIIILFIQAILSRRNVPVLTVTALPFMAASINQFIDEVSKDKISRKRLNTGGKVFLGIVLIITLIQLGIYLYGSYTFREEIAYPKSALSYLDTNYPDKRVFADYAWGGYIVWKSPSRKVFIDGRMPSWKWNENIEGESNDAMGEYLEVLQGDKPYNEIFDKYKVEVVIMPIEEEKKPKPWDSLDRKLRQFLGKKTEDFDFFEALEKDGWNEVYKDNIAVIYVKPS